MAARATGAGRTKAVLTAAPRSRGQDRAERVAARQPRLSLRQVAHVPRAMPAPRLSMGHLAGLHGTSDPLDLRSSVALVMDQDTNEVLFSKNEHAVLPIASLTKLMTGLIVSDARLPLDELITITHEDVDMVKGSSSRLPVGTTLTRGELMHLALMSSENRAAHALGRTFPGGLSRFVALMNARAIMLGMKDTRYVEPTGLSSANRSSAHDLATLVAVASQEPLLRQFSTSLGYEVAVGSRMLQYGNTNRLVHDPEWQIDLQKTGYISEAGRCLVMQARVGGRKLIMVFLDAHGKQSRLADAERVRRWVETELPSMRTVAGNDYAG
ncbi:MAG: serine hydrolase [Pseudomonadota bacterium]|nr:serine hydrolase [Pseudomonadota bacterium]